VWGKILKLNFDDLLKSKTFHPQAVGDFTPTISLQLYRNWNKELSAPRKREPNVDIIKDFRPGCPPCTMLGTGPASGHDDYDPVSSKEQIRAK
jgi:hypothetical protein